MKKSANQDASTSNNATIKSPILAVRITRQNRAKVHLHQEKESAPGQPSWFFAFWCQLPHKVSKCLFCNNCDWWDQRDITNVKLTCEMEKYKCKASHPLFEAPQEWHILAIDIPWSKWKGNLPVSPPWPIRKSTKIMTLNSPSPKKVAPTLTQYDPLFTITQLQRALHMNCKLLKTHHMMKEMKERTQPLLHFLLPDHEAPKQAPSPKTLSHGGWLPSH